MILLTFCAQAEQESVYLKAKLIGFTKDKIEFETAQNKRFLVERSRIPNIDQFIVGKAMIQVPLSHDELETLIKMK